MRWSPCSPESRVITVEGTLEPRPNGLCFEARRLGLGGDDPGSDPARAYAKAFLLKLGCEPTTERIMQIIELREAAHRFK